MVGDRKGSEPVHGGALEPGHGSIEFCVFWLESCEKVECFGRLTQLLFAFVE